MSSWIVVPCLLTLRNEFNTIGPHRDHGADGTIGDAAHSPSSDHSPDEDSPVLRGKDSDHTNEVHALDVDSSGPWLNGASFHDMVMFVVSRHQRGDDNRCEYIIHNRVIYSRSRDYKGIPYTEDDPHTNHAHFSARYTSAQESDTRTWGLIGEFMPLSDSDRTWIKEEIGRQLADLPHNVWAFDPGDADWAGVSSATYTDVNNGTVAPSTALESVLARRDADRKLLEKIAEKVGVTLP